MIQYNKADALNKGVRAKGSSVSNLQSLNNRVRGMATASPKNTAEANANARAKGSKQSMYRTIAK